MCIGWKDISSKLIRRRGPPAGASPIELSVSFDWALDSASTKDVNPFDGGLTFRICARLFLPNPREVNMRKRSAAIAGALVLVLAGILCLECKSH